MEGVKSFLDFELKYHLFDIVDKRGLNPWEAIRFYVMMNVLYNQNSPIFDYVKPSATTKIWKTIGKLVRFYYCFFRNRHKQIFFFLCSRDMKNGIIYDKISDGIYSLIDNSNCFSIESTGSCLEANYKYGSIVAPDVANVFVWFSRAKYDFTYIYELIKQTFPQSSVTIKDMCKSYKKFIGEYYYYRMIFNYCGTRKVFMVQNEIQKGMFAAANKIGVKLIELQHGQISCNHPAYSYPKESMLPARKVYHPDYLLTFGSFWSKNRDYPGVQDLVIGNNNYSERLEIHNTSGNKRLLVISNADEGKLLAQRVEEVLEKDPTFFFFFKLHPGQYKEYDSYLKRFEDNKSVEVVTNQKTINQLLLQCEGIFLNDSTVEVEALRLGRKVFVLTEQDYQLMDYMLEEEGVYPCKNVDDFLKVYESHKDEILECRDDFFSDFNEEMARELLLN